MQEDGRGAERVRSFLRAQIIYNNRASTTDCIVKNISATGAKIAIDEALSVPSEFDLHIPQKGRTYRARMAWRDATAIGVEFIDNEQAPAAEEAVPASELRLRSLELQNAELRSRVRELSRRLENLGQDPNIDAA